MQQENQGQVRTKSEIDSDLATLINDFRGTAERMVMQDDIDRINQWFRENNANPFMSDGPRGLSEWDFVNPCPSLECQIQIRLKELIEPYIEPLKLKSLHLLRKMAK